MMERRDLFKIMGATVMAESAGAFQHNHAVPEPGAYQLRFFTEPESFVIDRLADIIIPADERSPGAHDANVIRYIDLMAAYSDPEAKAQWHTWIDLVEAEAKRRFEKPFRECTREQHGEILASMAADEGTRTDEMAVLFARLKRLTIEGLHYSPVGLGQDLGYDATPLSEFPGCNHPEHHSR